MIIGIVTLAVPALPQAHAAAGTNFDNVVIVAMENQNYASVMGTGTGSSSAPFIASLLTQSSTIPSYHGYGAAGRSINGCSAGCYTALISGSDQGISDGYSCCINAPTLMDRMGTGGLTWQAYCESGCPRGNDHFPFTGFTSTSNSPNIFTSGSVSTANFVTAANSANPPNLLWFTPTDSHNMHDNSVQTGDSYLRSLLVGTGTLSSPSSGSLLASSLFQPGHRTMLLLWWDEYDPAPILFYGTMVKQAFISSSNGYDEFSVLHLLENNWALPTLTSNDAAASPMSEIYGTSTPPPLTTSFALSPSTPIVNLPVTLTATTTGGASPYTISWNFGDGTTGSGASLTHTFTSLQSYTVTETATDSSTPKQTATSTQTIAVVTSMPLSTSFTFLPPNPTVNSPVSFTSVTTGGTLPYTINWNFGDGATATGATATHTYTTAQSFTVSETATDSSSPKQTATTTRNVVVSSSLTGTFDSTWFINNCPGGTETITNGVLQTRQSTPGGGSNSYGYCTAQRGTFPWHSTVGTALPPGITSVTASFNFLSRSLLSGSRYHLYIALYYQIPSSSSGSTTYSWLDTQSRVENIDGSDSPIGSTATYDPGDSFGWDIVTLQVDPGQSAILTADTAQLCQGDLAAWGLPTNTQCTLMGIEIGTEGYTLNSVNVDWYNVNLNVGAIPLSTSFTASPRTPSVNVPVTFTATPVGGTSPYTYTIRFGDGGSGTGTTTTHAYSAVGSFTATVTVTDSASPRASISVSITVDVQALGPLTLTVPGNRTATTGSWINFTVTTADLNPGRTITLSATQLPAGATFDPSTGVFSWKPSSSQTGYYTITFTATDDSTPPSSNTRNMGIQVNQAAPGGSSGGGSGGSSNGGCLLCGTFPALATSTWLLLTGGLLGFISSLALLTIKARANLAHTKRRLNRLTRED